MQDKKKQMKAEAEKERKKKEEAEKLMLIKAENERKTNEEAERKIKEEKDTAQMIQNVARSREHKLASMSDRERRAEALERRLAAVKGDIKLCDNPECQRPLTRVPFERLTFKYCTTPCLRRHKELLNDPKYT